MAFIVMYERNDGSLAAESCQDLDAAVMAAERLRNSDSIEHPRIFETTEVEYEFETYFRVQIAGAAIDGDSTNGTDTEADTNTGFATTESAEKADIDWPSFESPTDDDEASAEAEVSEAEAGAYGIGVGELESPEIEGVELADADADADADVDVEVDADDETVHAEDDETYVSDLDVLNVEDEVAESDSDIDAMETEVTEGDQKVGLFDKFVKTLEGEGDGAADQVDDLTGNETTRRGLFGR